MDMGLLYAFTYPKSRGGWGHLIGLTFHTLGKDFALRIQFNLLAILSVGSDVKSIDPDCVIKSDKRSEYRLLLIKAIFLDLSSLVQIIESSFIHCLAYAMDACTFHCSFDLCIEFLL